MTQKIPLQPVQSQTVTTTLSGQPVRLNIYLRGDALYMDVLLNDKPIVTGVRCLDAVYVVRDQYHGFMGDLYFWDTQDRADPQWSGLGSRWILCYGVR